MPALIAILGGVALLFLGALLNTLVGAFAGWVVGLVFDDSMRLLAEVLNVKAAPYQLGAIFGFIGGFFRSSLTSSKD